MYIMTIMNHMINNVYFCLLAHLFLLFLADDGYTVLMKQQWLFHHYEKLVHVLEALPATQSKTIELCKAQVFYVYANICRRIDTSQSLQQAIQYHHKALALRTAFMQEHALKCAHSYVALGACYNELKGAENNRRAIAYYNCALAIYALDEEHTAYYRATTLNCLANAYRDLDGAHIPLAINYQDTALMLFTALPQTKTNQCEQGKMLYNQGVNYHRLGGIANHKIATRYLHQARLIFEQHQDSIRYALTLSYLGKVSIDMGYKTVATRYLQEALPLLQKLYANDHSAVVEVHELLDTDSPLKDPPHTER